MKLKFSLILLVQSFLYLVATCGLNVLETLYFVIRHTLSLFVLYNGTLELMIFFK